ncbi:MAG: histidine kinase N-terminal domain-containing protein [Chloroflexota bacterium]|nr:histidine kinase N-terminal domain-containing protein [Chloroflexota bacterium]
MFANSLLPELDLEKEDRALLHKIKGDMPILSDLCRADLLLVCEADEGVPLVVGQWRPHSSSALYEDSQVGVHFNEQTHPSLFQALRGNVRPRKVHTIDVKGATVAREIFPIYGANDTIIAVMVKDAYWLAYERHRRRNKAFQNALLDFISMVLRGDVHGADSLSSFGERDGIVYIDANGSIRYMSGIAAELYRHLGYRDSLLNRPIGEIATIDKELVQEAVKNGRCIERKTEEGEFTWVRKALPIRTPRHPFVLGRLLGLRSRGGGEMQPRGVLILCHDATEALEAQREIESKMAMIREVHHRVKNNLQVIASIMRLQARRAAAEETKVALAESVNRILSVAVVHDFLSRNAKGTINVQDIARRIVNQTKESLIGPDRAITLVVKGPDIWLSAERATRCALVVNELVQNAIEHGMMDRDVGSVYVEFVDHGEKVTLVVSDDGWGLASGFDLQRDAHLGLNMVQRMVERDLAGQFTLTSVGGTRATVEFDKSA